jgi:hypothetical protein
MCLLREETNMYQNINMGYVIIKLRQGVHKKRQSKPHSKSSGYSSSECESER